MKEYMWNYVCILKWLIFRSDNFLIRCYKILMFQSLKSLRLTQFASILFDNYDLQILSNFTKINSIFLVFLKI